MEGLKLQELKELLNSAGQNRKVNPHVPSLIVGKESGFYKFMLRSDKLPCIKFADWVVDEVLPTIRRTGSYSLPTTTQQASPLLLPPLSPSIQLYQQTQEIRKQARTDIESIINLIRAKFKHEGTPKFWRDMPATLYTYCLYAVTGMTPSQLKDTRCDPTVLYCGLQSNVQFGKLGGLLLACAKVATNYLLPEDLTKLELFLINVWSHLSLGLLIGKQWNLWEALQ